MHFLDVDAEQIYESYPSPTFLGLGDGDVICDDQTLGSQRRIGSGIGSGRRPLVWKKTIGLEEDH